MNTAKQYIPTRRESLGWRLFPQSFHADIPDKPNMHDAIISEVSIEISFTDRLRLLISGRARCSVKTATQNLIGDSATNSSFNVMPPSWLQR